jgi:hypothetical protein
MVFWQKEQPIQAIFSGNSAALQAEFTVQPNKPHTEIFICFGSRHSE